MVNILVEVVNGISAIQHEIQSIMSSTQIEWNLIHSSKWNQILMNNLFADSRRASGGWQFFDSILEQYFLTNFKNDIDIDSYVKQVSCIFTAICLCEPDDFVRFIFDIYSEPTNENYISMSNLELLLQLIIGSVGGKKIVEEILSSMSLYASVVANKTDKGMYTMDNKIYLKKNIPTQYYTRKHKHGLWPLEVVQNQIKEKFLGSEFWERVRKGNLASINLYSSNAPCLTAYLEIISLVLKEAPEVKKKQISDNSTLPIETSENSQNSQIIENDGIYTLKSTANLGSGHAISFLRRPVLARKSFNRLTDDDNLTGIDCPYVNESDIAMLKQHMRTPSPDPFNRSSHGNSRHSSRQNSPIASKSSSFSFDMGDMGESLPGSNGGIATRTSLLTNSTISSSTLISPPPPPAAAAPSPSSQLIGSSNSSNNNLLRNRPNYKVPARLITSNLPPLSNHSSRSSSPSFLNQGCSPGTSTTTSSENVPLDSVSQEGGLSDILLEATYLMKGLKILIIEDSTFQRKLMTKKLHKTGGGEGQISRRPSGTLNFDKKLSCDQIEGVSIPLNSPIHSSPMNGTSRIFNFPEISNPISPTMISANMIPRPPTPSEIISPPELAIDFPSASASPFTITLQSPSSIYNTNTTNEVLTPSQVTHLTPERETNGWQVSEAVNGEEAIQRLISTKETFDIIFVDENLQSTGGNLLGHEVVRILRGHHSVPSSTIIIGCSSTAEQNALLFLEAGANAVWKKPMPSDEKIRNEICKYLAGI